MLRTAYTDKQVRAGDLRLGFVDAKFAVEIGTAAYYGRLVGFRDDGGDVRLFVGAPVGAGGETYVDVPRDAILWFAPPGMD